MNAGRIDARVSGKDLFDFGTHAHEGSGVGIKEALESASQASSTTLLGPSGGQQADTVKGQQRRDPTPASGQNAKPVGVGKMGLQQLNVVLQDLLAQATCKSEQIPESQVWHTHGATLNRQNFPRNPQRGQTFCHRPATVQRADPSLHPGGIVGRGEPLHIEFSPSHFQAR
jgi:hypothetical protein